MDKLRKAEIDWYLNNETNEEWTLDRAMTPSRGHARLNPARPLNVAVQDREWRDELTEEESTYVQRRDTHFERGIARICTAILVRDLVRQRWAPEEIAEIETIGDHCRVTLRSGEAYLARLAPGGGLKLEKIIMGGDGRARRLGRKKSPADGDASTGDSRRKGRLSPVL